MTAMTDSGAGGGGRPAPPEALFCPVCGRPNADRAGPSQPEPDPWASWFAPPRSPSGPQPWPTPPGDPQQWAARQDATRADGPGLRPFGDSPTDLFESLPSAAASAGPRRRPDRLLVVVVAAVALAAVVAALVITHSLSGGSAAR